MSPTTGTITVAGAPCVVDDVEQYLKMQNRLRLRRVAIETRVLSVTLAEEYDYNFDLSTFPIVLLVSETECAKELTDDAKEFANEINSQIFMISAKDNDTSTESLIYMLHRIPKINIQTKKVKKEKECTIS